MISRTLKEGTVATPSKINQQNKPETLHATLLFYIYF